jgi:methylmalonyl-CoA/ethylmalonyl-CoA epimerase
MMFRKIVVLPRVVNQRNISIPSHNPVERPVDKKRFFQLTRKNPFDRGAPFSVIPNGCLFCLCIAMDIPAGFLRFGELNHIAVLVRDLGKAIEKFQFLGGKLLEQEHLAESGTDVAVVEIGGAHVEFLSTRQSGSKVGRLLEQQGEGIHHLSFQVENLESALEGARQTGIRLRDQVPRRGLHGRRIAFLDPSDTCGILIELVEESEPK